MILYELIGSIAISGTIGVIVSIVTIAVLNGVSPIEVIKTLLGR